MGVSGSQHGFLWQLYVNWSKHDGRSVGADYTSGDRISFLSLFDSRSSLGINDSLLRKILYLSLVQQQGQLQETQTNIVTGLVDPQPSGSVLEHDARFSAFFAKEAETGGGAPWASGGDAEVETLLLMLKTGTAEPAARLTATTDVVNRALMRILRLSEPMDPARPLSVYGIDSFSAVEVRNWVRADLGAMVTTLDILNASSLAAFCQKIVSKIEANIGK